MSSRLDKHEVRDRPGKCVKCKMCMKAGCPALNFRDGTFSSTALPATAAGYVCRYARKKLSRGRYRTMKKNDTKSILLVGVADRGPYLPLRSFQKGWSERVMTSRCQRSMECHSARKRYHTCQVWDRGLLSCSSRRRSRCTCCIRKGRGGTLA